MFYDPNNPDEVSKALLAKWFWSEELREEWYSLLIPDCHDELKGDDKLWFEFLSEVRGYSSSIPYSESQLQWNYDLEKIFKIFENIQQIDEEVIDKLSDLSIFQK